MRARVRAAPRALPPRATPARPPARPPAASPSAPRLPPADFGHILGHFKYKLGIKRERAVFVFTPQMAHVLGGTDGAAFKDFLAYARAAYSVLRRHGNLLLTLFSLMLSCGLPELRTGREIEWMRRALKLDLGDDADACAAAEQAFEETIFSCLNTRATQVNDAFHMCVSQAAPRRAAPRRGFSPHLPSALFHTPRRLRHA